jgi:hypothetical protein
MTSKYNTTITDSKESELWFMDKWYTEMKENIKSGNFTGAEDDIMRMFNLLRIMVFYKEHEPEYEAHGGNSIYEGSEPCYIRDPRIQPAVYGKLEVVERE